MARADYRLTVQAPHWFGELLDWVETWREVLPDAARDDFVKIVRSAIHIESNK